MKDDDDYVDEEEDDDDGDYVERNVAAEKGGKAFGASPPSTSSASSSPASYSSPSSSYPNSIVPNSKKRRSNEATEDEGDGDYEGYPPHMQQQQQKQQQQPRLRKQRSRRRKQESDDEEAEEAEEEEEEEGEFKSVAVRNAFSNLGRRAANSSSGSSSLPPFPFFMHKFFETMKRGKVTTSVSLTAKKMLDEFENVWTQRKGTYTWCAPKSEEYHLLRFVQVSK